MHGTPLHTHCASPHPHQSTHSTSLHPNHSTHCLSPHPPPRDLLACRRGGSKIDDKNPIKHDPDTGVAVVQGAVREAISCCEDAHDMIRR